MYSPHVRLVLPCPSFLISKAASVVMCMNLCEVLRIPQAHDTQAGPTLARDESPSQIARSHYIPVCAPQFKIIPAPVRRRSSI